MKKIVILTGSPRPKGNSSAMAEAFAARAEQNGHTVGRFNCAAMSIHGCRACETCYQTGKPCSFDDDFNSMAPAILEADARGLQNFSVYCAHKTTPPALRAISNDPETTIDGFILPGHVATITGLAPFGFLVDEFETPGVVTGFEPVDILQGICMLVQMVVENRPAIDNAYRRGVNADGNPVARQLVEQVFEPCDAAWRGLGPIANSGLSIRPEFARFDAGARFDVPIEPTVEPRGCRCGDVLRGAITPSDCPLFGHACTPEHPVGPCMVSSEGSCAAYFRYRD